MIHVLKKKHFIIKLEISANSLSVLRRQAVMEAIYEYDAFQR